MYMRFFGLKQEPFSLAPDPRYLYMSKRHREALAHLLYGVGGGGGFVLLSGEIGAGKTTVCRCFLEQIPKRCNVAYIFNPKLTVLELVKSVCDEFRIPVAGERGQPPTVKTYVDALNEFLLKTHAVGQNNVLIIDEAQMLSVDVLEQLRLLTNLETNERKLLQIVLIGQPELRTMLERPDLEQLAQRVIARFHLKALSSKETEHYIRHRLSVAGMTRSIPFDRKALQRIHEIARGVPRRINLLCDRAMLGAYAHGKTSIDSEIVEKSAREVFGKSEPNGPDRSRFGSSAGLGLFIATGLALTALLAFAIYGAYRKFVTPAPVAASAPMAASASAASAATPGGASAPASAAASLPAASGSAAGWGATPASAAGSAPATLATVAAKGTASGAAASAPASSLPASAAVVAALPPTAAAAGAVLGAAEIKAQWKALGRDEKAAWRELAALWKVDPGDGDPCAAVARQQVRCYKFATTLATLKSLDRPGFLSVRDEAGRSTTVLLLGLRDDTATLLAQGQPQRVSLAALTKLWQGEFGTLWRMPPGYTTALAEGATGPLVDRLATQLAGLAGEPAPPPRQTMDSGLRAKVVRFQTANGLSAVGKAGPTTFMQLNRATGVDEPRLAAP
ncbi:MAG: AAA family ATPase [Burkholderiales bacterium]|nr:AAA family ATPase [Burkholderiales bacterium]